MFCDRLFNIPLRVTLLLLGEKLSELRIEGVDPRKILDDILNKYVIDDTILREEEGLIFEYYKRLYHHLPKEELLERARETAASSLGSETYFALKVDPEFRDQFCKEIEEKKKELRGILEELIRTPKISEIAPEGSRLITSYLSSFPNNTPLSPPISSTPSPTLDSTSPS